MELIAEGLTLCFIGILIILVTSLGSPQSPTANIAYLTCSAMLIIMAILTTLTGAKTPALPYKICPMIKTIVAILYFPGSIL
jgi:hypothetical protein